MDGSGCVRMLEAMTRNHRSFSTPPAPQMTPASPRRMGLLLAALALGGGACATQADGATGQAAAGATAGNDQAAPFSAEPDVAKARAWIADGALVIDVRTAEEFQSGHLPSARLLPVQELPARIDEVRGWVEGDVERPIVVYCRSGARATRAAELLHEAGFAQVQNGGGFTQLQP